MILRKLTATGCKRFHEFISDTRRGGNQPTPTGLLDDPKSSQSLPWQVVVEPAQFPTRYDLGVYLVGLLSGVNVQDVLGDSGFWDAISLVFFDQLCPVRKDGTRKPAKVYNYCLSDEYWHRSRHAIFSTYQLVSSYGETSRFLLSKPLNTRGELIEQLMARQYYISCRGVMDAASKLYYDKDKQTFKRGAAGRKSAGCVYRYVAWLQQIEMTYDVYSMSSDELVGLLPREFDRFLQNSKADD